MFGYSIAQTHYSVDRDLNLYYFLFHNLDQNIRRPSYLHSMSAFGQLFFSWLLKPEAGVLFIPVPSCEVVDKYGVVISVVSLNICSKAGKKTDFLILSPLQQWKILDSQIMASQGMD